MTDIERAIAIVESWDDLNPGFTMAEFVADAIAEVRRETVEQCAQWHISRAKQCRESASRRPENSDDRQQLLSEAVWHYDCVDLLRALAPTAKEPT